MSKRIRDDEASSGSDSEEVLLRWQATRESDFAAAADWPYHGQIRVQCSTAASAAALAASIQLERPLRPSDARRSVLVDEQDNRILVLGLRATSARLLRTETSSTFSLLRLSVETLGFAEEMGIVCSS
mmetsp:Transcript_7819/g.25061  ORF Transcript_7819/g.25061 Transcript_7819/m.25061 type:complete len:128 (-) Transcript_7819:9-392(-)